MGFSAGGETDVKSFENGVEANRTGGGHPQDAADLGAAATNAALSAECAAVVVVGCDADQGGGFVAVDNAQFGDAPQERAGGRLADAFDLFKARGRAALASNSGFALRSEAISCSRF